MSEEPTILVVDDDGPTLTLMRALLGRFGFQVITAADGVQALDAARRQKPALALVDRNMPGMSGEEAIRGLRAQPELGALPILILSGERVPDSELVRLGANGAVEKPFEVPLLIEQIRRHL